MTVRTIRGRPRKGAEADWAAIRRQFEDSAVSIRELARRHELSDRAVRKQIKKGGWTRSATGKSPSAETTLMPPPWTRPLPPGALLPGAPIDKPAPPPPAPDREQADMPEDVPEIPSIAGTSPTRPRVSKEIEEAAADPEKIVGRGRAIAARLLDELDVTTAHLGELEDEIMAATEGDSTGRRRSALQSAISLPQRSATLKNITQALKTMNEAIPGRGGKKAQRSADAKQAATGRFAPPAPPKLIVDNG